MPPQRSQTVVAIALGGGTAALGATLATVSIFLSHENAQEYNQELQQRGYAYRYNPPIPVPYGPLFSLESFNTASCRLFFRYVQVYTSCKNEKINIV